MLRGGHFLAIQPGTDNLYHPMRDDNRVLVIDTKTDAITKIITVNGGPARRRLRAQWRSLDHCDGDGSVAAIDGNVIDPFVTLKNVGAAPSTFLLRSTRARQIGGTTMARRKTSRSSTRPRARWRCPPDQVWLWSAISPFCNGL